MTDHPFTPSPVTPVERVADGDRWTLVFVRELRHPPAEVWHALTDPDQLRAWSPFTADRPLDTMGDVTLHMIDGDDEVSMAGVVHHADAPRLLVYLWGDDLLRWELEPSGGGTRLTLRHTVEAEPWLPRVAAGWHLCLDVAERYLDGDPVGPIVGAAAKDHGWDALHDAYAAQLGVNDG
jgi:uncharacterized protein YndB with AHSA1/START domain